MSTRDAYVEKLKAQLDQWNADIDKLEAKGRELQADAQVSYNKKLEDLRTRRDEAAGKLEEIQSASEHAWEDLKAGTEMAWDSLSEAVSSAWSQFK